MSKNNTMFKTAKTLSGTLMSTPNVIVIPFNRETDATGQSFEGSNDVFDSLDSLDLSHFNFNISPSCLGSPLTFPILSQFHVSIIIIFHSPTTIPHTSNT